MPVDNNKKDSASSEDRVKEFEMSTMDNLEGLQRYFSPTIDGIESDGNNQEWSERNEILLWLIDKLPYGERLSDYDDYDNPLEIAKRAQVVSKDMLSHPPGELDIQDLALDLTFQLYGVRDAESFLVIVESIIKKHWKISLGNDHIQYVLYGTDYDNTDPQSYIRSNDIPSLWEHAQSLIKKEVKVDHDKVYKYVAIPKDLNFAKGFTHLDAMKTWLQRYVVNSHKGDLTSDFVILDLTGRDAQIYSLETYINWIVL